VEGCTNVFALLLDHTIGFLCTHKALALNTHICMFVRIYVCIVLTYLVFVCMCFAWYCNFHFLLSFHDYGIVVWIGC